MPQLPDRIAGALLVTAACLCWSSGGILVRLLNLDAIVIVFWRSLFMALVGRSIVLAAVIGLIVSEHLPLLPAAAAKQSP